MKMQQVNGHIRSWATCETGNHASPHAEILSRRLIVGVHVESKKSKKEIKTTSRGYKQA